MKTKVVKKICNLILDILIFIFGIILLISIYNGIQVKIMKKTYADFFGYSTFEVQTGSMSPTINASDLIIVKKNNTPEVKDIITYEKDGDFITHRVVEAYKGTYVTKGDANNTKDEAIKQDQIVGKVVKIIPHFGIIRKTILNPIVLITLIITIYIISLIFKKNDEKSKVDMMFAKIYKKLKIFRKNVKKLMDEKKNKSLDDFLEDNNNDIVNIEKPPISTVSVNMIESVKLDENVNNEDVKEIMLEETNKEIPEEDLDKTIYFRKVLVDKEDLEPTNIVIEEEESVDVIKEINEPIEEESSEVKSKLEYLQKRKKKFNSIIEKIVFIKKEELNEILTSLTNNEKMKTNEPLIKEEFIKNYIDARYYNHCGDVNVSYNSKNIITKIEENLNEFSNKLIKGYKGNDNKFSDKVKKYNNLFAVVLYLEQYYKLFDEVELKVDAYKKKIFKYLKGEYSNEKVILKKVKEIINIQKIYDKIIDSSLRKMDTNTFELKYNQLISKKTMYGLNLEHNINFSKVYSNYIVDKTYSEGIVAEDKLLVTINLLLCKIAENMINKEFKNNYILYIPSSLYDKDNKINKVLNLLDDENVKNSVLLLIKYDVLVKHKKEIKEMKKRGYKIAIIFDTYSEIKEKDKAIISIANYIFIDKKINKILGVSSIITDSISTTIIQEDIIDKVGISGGE